MKRFDRSQTSFGADGVRIYIHGVESCRVSSEPFGVVGVRAADFDKGYRTLYRRRRDNIQSSKSKIVKL